MAHDDRWSEPPPLPARLKYRLFNLPPDGRYRPWVEQDMSSRWWVFRSMLPVFIGYMLGATVMGIWTGGLSPAFLIGSTIGFLIAAFLIAMIPPYRRWIQRRHIKSYEKRWARQAPAHEHRTRSWLATHGISAVGAAIMFGSIFFAAICWGATLMTLMIWGDVHLPVLLAAIIATIVATGSGVLLFRSTARWP